jgi:hypothetical protein
MKLSTLAWAGAAFAVLMLLTLNRLGKALE